MVRSLARPSTSATRSSPDLRAPIWLNAYTGLAAALVAGAGIGDLPPVVQPGLIGEGRIVEVMRDWRFRTFDLSLVHLGNRHVPRPVRAFTDFAARMAVRLFPGLPK